MFFIYKKGDAKDPNNYRSICIQNPILKVFCLILSQRLNIHVEKEFLLPEFEFAYRKNRSTIGAVGLLDTAIQSRLNRKTSKSLRTYAAYIDYRKCFDSINREKLFELLINIGISVSFCQIIDFIYRKT